MPGISATHRDTEGARIFRRIRKIGRFERFCRKLGITVKTAEAAVLVKLHSDFFVGSPDSAAGATLAVDDSVEIGWNGKGG